MAKLQLNVLIDEIDMQALRALQARYADASQAHVVRMLIRDRVKDLQQSEGFSVQRTLGQR